MTGESSRPSDSHLVEIAQICKNSPAYFPQLVCALSKGHDGDHDDRCGYKWEDGA